MTVLTPTAVAASTFNSTGFEAAKAIDGDATINSRWAAGSGFPQWLRLDMGSAVAIDYYSIAPGQYDATQDPSAWTFEGSNDTTSWTTLDTKSAQTFSGKGSRAFAATGTYRYYRLNISAAGGGVASIAEFQVGTNFPAAATPTETVTGTVTNGSSVSATITTTPAAGQTVVAAFQTDAGGIATCSGLGATWTKVYEGMGAASGGSAHSIWVGVGATSSGAITGTTTSGSLRNVQLIVNVVSNLASPKTIRTGGYNSATLASPGQMVIGSVYESGGGSPVLSASSTPAPASWTLGTRFDPSGTVRINQAWRFPTAEASHNLTWSGLGAAGADQIVIGMPATVGTSSTPVSLTGQVSALTIAAPAGSVSVPAVVALAGAVSALTVAAPAGAVVVGGPNVSLTGQVAALSIATPAGSVATQPRPALSVLGATAGTMNGSVSVTFSTPTLTGNACVLVLTSVGTNSVTSVTGLGATWTVAHSTSNADFSHFVIVGTGATGTGTITVNVSQSGAGARVGYLRAYKLTGIDNPALSAADTVANTSTTGITGPTHTPPAGSVVVANYTTSATNAEIVSFPATQTPSGAYSTQAFLGYVTSLGWTGQAFALPTDPVPHTTSGSYSSATTYANRLTQVVLIPAALGPVNLTGAPAALTIAAPAGTVTAGTVAPVSLTGAVASLTIAAPAGYVAVGTVPPYLSATLSGGGTISATGSFSVVTTRATLSGGGGLRANLPRTWQDDPRTGRPQWRYLIAHRDGSLFGELFDVAVEPIEAGVNERTRFSFTVPTDGVGNALIKPTVRECQAWRGGHLMAKGPILPVNDRREGTTTYQVADPSWYYSEGRRVISQIPKRNLLPNGDFLEGLNGWHGGWEANSIPATFPLTSVVDDEYAPGGKALEITGADKTQLVVQETQTGSAFAPNSATYISGGEAIIQGIGANIPEGSTIRLTGHTANDGTGDGLDLSLNRAKAAKATLSAMGKGFIFALADTSSYKPGTFKTGDNCVGRGYYSPIASNTTETGMAKNRRVTIAYEGLQPATGSAQFEHRFLDVDIPAGAKVPLSLTLVGLMKIMNWIGPNRPGWAMWMGVTRAGETDPISEANVPMDEFTPRGRWISPAELGSATVEVPPVAGSYQVEVRFYAPAGTVRWTRLRLYPEDGLRFFDEDQATIVAGIAEFMQDPAFGWADLHIGWRTPPTGVIRDRREYKFYEQRPVDVALQEFTALSRGMDIAMLTTKDTATIATFYPRQGGPTDVTIEDGGIGVAYEPAANRDVASLIIAQADGSGVARPEEYAIDDEALDGMRLANIVNAENETPINELDELAALELRRAKVTTPAYWVTCHPKWTSYLLDNLGMGDTCRLILPREGVNALARLVKRSIDPNTDVLRLFLALED